MKYFPEEHLRIYNSVIENVDYGVRIDMLRILLSNVIDVQLIIEALYEIDEYATI